MKKNYSPIEKLKQSIGKDFSILNPIFFYPIFFTWKNHLLKRNFALDKGTRSILSLTNC